MTHVPHVSVIIPTYNRAALLRQATESVLRQTYRDWEIVVVDDGSTDGTAAMMETLIRQEAGGAERIRYLAQENQGKSAALNHGLKYAQGEWIAFLDSDDQWLPSKLEEQFYAIGQCTPRSEACFTNARYINNPALQTTAFERARRQYKKQRGVITNPAELIANPYGVFMQTLLVHSRIMKKVGEFDETLRVVHDVDIVLRIALETPLCFVNLPLVMIDRTPTRSDGLIELMAQKDERDVGAEIVMYERLFRLSERLGNDARKAVQAHLRDAHSQRANWLLTHKRYSEALHDISAASRLDLTFGIAAKWCLAALCPPLARSAVLFRSRFATEPSTMPGAKCPPNVLDNGIPRNGQITDETSGTSARCPRTQDPL